MTVQLMMLQIGRVLDVRWVASSLRTVLAVFTNYPALYKHFADAANDVKLNSSWMNCGVLFSQVRYLCEVDIFFTRVKISSCLRQCKNYNT